LSANVAESSGATWTVSSHGVRQACPTEVLTSAPGGSDSNRNAAVGGDELRKFKLGIDAEHAATVKPHATTAMTRLMIRIPPLGRHMAALPHNTHPASVKGPREPKVPRRLGAGLKVRLKCGGDKVKCG
jgi:hypothetical protein